MNGKTIRGLTLLMTIAVLTVAGAWLSSYDHRPTTILSRPESVDGTFLIPEVQAQETDTNLTVYNQNLALVRDTRTLDLDRGVNEVRFANVAAQIDPTSVHVQSRTDPENTLILEQNYEYDIVGSEALLQKYLDQEITLVAEDGTEFSGTLLSGAGDVILEDEDGGVMVIARDRVRQISFPDLPDGLITRPTLVWLLDAGQSGQQTVDVTYMTNGIDWRANYVVHLNEDDTALDLNGWVTLDNRSGATYNDARLKLVAGDVNVVRDEMARMARDVAAEAPAPTEQPVQEREFFEYHLYDVQRPVTVRNNQTKQIEFSSASTVPAEKFFVYDGARGLGFYGYPVTDPGYGINSNPDVNIYLQIENEEDAGLGIPLPAGKVRVYKADVDDTLQFVGEDQIDHTPRDEPVRLLLGNAFDIVGERRQTDFDKIGDSVIEESFEIQVRNHKDEAAEVRVVEHLFRWSEWEIVEESTTHTKLDQGTVEWRLSVPADGERTVTYTVRYEF